MPKDEGREIITSLEGGEVQVDGTSAAGVPEKFLCRVERWGFIGLWVRKRYFCCGLAVDFVPFQL